MSAGSTKPKKSMIESSEELVVKRRQLGWVVAGSLLSCFCLFMIGYFLGQNKAVERFVEKADRDSFADQLYYSLCSLYDVEDEPATETSLDQEVTTEVSEEVAVAHDTQNASLQKAVVQEPVEYQYYAELIGFGTAASAQQFAKKMLGKRVPVEVHKRRSKTAKGKTVFWYQVATEKFTDYEALEQLVEKVKKEEYIQDVRIVRC